MTIHESYASQVAYDLIYLHLRSIAHVFDDELTTEIMVNPNGWVWIEDHRSGMWKSNTQLSSDDRQVIIEAVASFNDRVVNEDSPEVAGVLPVSGARFQGIIPPAVSAPTFTIRLPASQTFALKDYLDKGTITKAQVRLIAQAVKDRKNILVAGGTGSGKTTFSNAVLRLIAREGHRIMTIEDTPELVCEAPNTLAVYVNRQGAFDYQRALFTALRMRPDRIIVGELRDGLATLELLKAWNTGHNGGLATIHANSAASTLPRVEQLLDEVMQKTPRALIAQAIDLVVFLERYSENGRPSRRIADVASVRDELVQGQYVLTHTYHDSLEV